MGRKRKDNSLNLPKRVYINGGKFFYVHPNGKWELLGTDVAAAREKGSQYNDLGSDVGTLTWYMVEFMAFFANQVKTGQRAPRTLKDYNRYLGPLKTFFGHMQPDLIRPEHVVQYLEIGNINGRGVSANREKACLSSFFSWYISKGYSKTLVNPCLKRYGVKRNKETARKRYVTDAEWAAVKLVAVPSIVLALELVYRTLQRPSDVLKWDDKIIVQKTPTERVIRFIQAKRKKPIDIAITGDLAAVILKSRGYGGRTFVHTRQGEPYSYDGLGSMLRDACKKAGVKSFGLGDLKAKGATDMYRNGVPLEQIKELCNHSSIKTTEIYVKRHWTETIQPNTVNARKKST